jgi:hypothetical protein
MEKQRRAKITAMRGVMSIRRIAQDAPKKSPAIEGILIVGGVPVLGVDGYYISCVE